MVGAADILNARILIVDDTSVNVLLLEHMLRGAGYTAVTSTTDPRAVSALYREHRHDLILLDLLMPGMDGFEVMHELQAIETEGYLPVLVLTAQPAHKLRALEAGAKDFVSKPFDRIEVLTRIHNMLEVRLLLRDSRRYSHLLEHYDQLTCLPNRELYGDLLAQTLVRSAAHQRVVSVLFVAVDRYPHVREALGEVMGDALLRRVADRLVGCLGPMDTVARLAGGTFGLVVVTGGGDPYAAGMAANTVRAALRPALALEGSEVAVAASIGVAVSPTDASDAETLMTYAAAALEAATDAGGDTYRLYAPEMNARAVAKLELEGALRHALEHDEFILHYQPRVRIDTGEWSGVEALLRWDRPGHGLIQPEAFLPVLQDTGLIVPVGTWIIEAACRQIADWARDGTGALRVAVNISASQFLRDGFVAAVARAVKGHAIAPGSLELEISERSLLAPSEETDRILRDLKALGVRVAIDDFGTGYAGLAYLKQVPGSTLKIDLGFLRDRTTDRDAAAIAVAIITMARSLKMEVIAEGVDTEAQLAFLREHAGGAVQGFYRSLPLPAAELAVRREGHRAAVPALAT